MQIFDNISKKIDKIVLVFAFIVLALSFYFVYTLNQSYTKKEAVQSIDNALLLTRNLLEEQQQHALSLSLLLAQDKSFLKAYYHDNRKAAYSIINHKIKSLKKLQGYSFDVQVHDKNLHTYLRSWDFSITGIPLASFREGLVLVKKYKKPLVSIEVGKRLNIKAISPIMKEEKFQGSIEVIENFEHLREKLSEHGYTLFMLLDKRYLSIATTLIHQPKIAEHFILANKIYDKNAFWDLKNAHVTTLGNYGYFTHGQYLFGYFELKNFHNQSLGYCIIAAETKAPLLAEEYHRSVSLEKNSSGIIIQ